MIIEYLSKKYPGEIYYVSSDINDKILQLDVKNLYIGHGFGDGEGYPSDYKLNLFQGIIDDVRIYSRVISEDEIDTLFNLSDSEPPVPGNQGTVTK